MLYSLSLRRRLQARLRLTAIALAAIAVTASLVSASSARTFTVVPGVAALPSAELPNAPASLRLPSDGLAPPAFPKRLAYGELLALWQEAGEAYGIRWEILAAINEIESNFGANMGPSSAGAIGWMQFLPSTWERWGMDATGDGIADPWDPTDAVFAAARYLQATGARSDLAGALFSYNRSDEYVQAVLGLADEFLRDPLRASERVGNGSAGADARADMLQPAAPEQLDRASAEVKRLAGALGEFQQKIETFDRRLLEAERRTGDPTLSDRAWKETVESIEKLTNDRQQETVQLERTREALIVAEQRLTQLENQIATVDTRSQASGLNGLLGAPPTPQAAAVISFATSKLGTPYLWGGNHGFSLEQMMNRDPLPGVGFDCSSLLAWAFAKGAGIYIGDWTGAQWALGETDPGAIRGAGPAQGGSAPAGGYRPGDLIFFNITGHVGMYLGNDLFIHAPRTGDVVKISRLSEYSAPWGWVRWTTLTEPVDGAAWTGASTSERVFTVIATP